MFRITEQHASGRLVLKLEGRLSAPCLSELDASWRSAMDAPGGQSIWVDLSDVWLVDRAACEQLARMHRSGVRFLTRGGVMREWVREISESS